MRRAAELLYSFLTIFAVKGEEDYIARLQEAIAEFRESLDRPVSADSTYTALRSGCKASKGEIRSITAPSLAACQAHCDASMVRCDTVGYDAHRQSCVLTHGCTDGLAGMCLPFETQCMFTKGAYKLPPSTTHRDKLQMQLLKLNVLEDAGDIMEDMLRAETPADRAGAICQDPVFYPRDAVETLNVTMDQSWRYYSAFRCGQRSERVCLTYKEDIMGRKLAGIASADGIHFASPDVKRSSVRLLMKIKKWKYWTQSQFIHNLAVLPLGDERYAFVGGQQHFHVNKTCRDALPRPIKHKHVRMKCLIEDRGPDGPMQVNGVRLSFSRLRPNREGGLHWTVTRFHNILHGSEPGNCIDRRPQTGWPTNTACEFDGRFSFVHLADGGYRLYARANLRFGQMAGGRFVQTTVTNSPLMAMGSWSPWEQISIASVDPSKVDLYFFAVQRNPLSHAAGLLALFPVLQPPRACVALAFSRDGVRFSKPINLHNARVAVYLRTHITQFPQLNSSSDPQLIVNKALPLLDQEKEWRAEDHPVAGAVLAPGDPSSVLFYIHHEVRGMTMRKEAVPRVSVYRMQTSTLARLSEEALRSLR